MKRGLKPTSFTDKFTVECATNHRNVILANPYIEIYLTQPFPVFAPRCCRRGPAPRLQLLQPLCLFRHVCGLEMLSEIINPVKLLFPITFTVLVNVLEVRDELLHPLFLAVRPLVVLQKASPTKSADVVPPIIPVLLAVRNQWVLQRFASPVMRLDMYRFHVSVGFGW